GTVLSGLEQAFEDQHTLYHAVEDADGAADVGVATQRSASGGEPSDVGAVAYVPRSGEFEPMGVCMVSDIGPDVVRLPRCADLISEQGDDSQDVEDDEEESAEAPEPVIITVTRSDFAELPLEGPGVDRKSTRLNSSHVSISYA